CRSHRRSRYVALGPRRPIDATREKPSTDDSRPAYEGKTMKALLLTDYKRLEVTEVDEPQMGPEDVLIQVEACGICGSDIHGYDGSTGRRIPPLIMGHEAAGIVVSVGSDVD